MGLAKPQANRIARRKIAVQKSLPGDDRPGFVKSVGQAVEIERGNQNARGPTGRQQEPAVAEISHPFFAAGEMQQRNHGQRQLHRQHYLTQHQQLVTLLSPRSPMMTTAGMIAIKRVISRRTHGRMRQCMKPSITTCPASVPVIVLL